MSQSQSWIARAVAGGIFKWFGFQLAALAGPTLLGLAATILGKLSGDGTWSAALAAGALTFGGTAAGVYFTLAVLDRYAVKGRLALQSPRIAVAIDSGEISLGINLSNLADVGIEFEVVELVTQLSGKFPSSKPFERKTFEIPPHGVGFFSDHVIPVDRESTSGMRIDGTINGRIVYGRPGSRKYELLVKYGVHLQLDPSGSIGSWAWEVIA